MPSGQANLFVNYEKLEDNVTHGFISLLQCVRPTVAQNILQQICDQDIQLSSPLSFDLQSPSKKTQNLIAGSRRAFVLGIASMGTSVHEDISSKRDSRADGWIVDGKTAVLMESKVVPHFSGDQLTRHKKQLREYGLEDSRISEVSTTWQRVDFCLKELLGSTEVEHTEMTLINEYRRFLQMSGLSLELERFFNGTEYDLADQWASEDPKSALRLLKGRLAEECSLVQDKKEQVNETNVNFYWVRLFTFTNGGIEWRGTAYLSPDGVSVDVMAFEPKKTDIPAVLARLMEIGDGLGAKCEQDLQRTWIYATLYGKRRNVQRGRNYEYCALNVNLARAPEGLRSVDALADLAQWGEPPPKQVGLKYTISNPGADSNSYWTETNDDVNHEEAELLKDPERIIEKFSSFLEEIARPVIQR